MSELIARPCPLMPDWVESPDGSEIVYLDDNGSYLGRAVRVLGPTYELSTGEWVDWCYEPLDETIEQYEAAKLGEP